MSTVTGTVVAEVTKAHKEIPGHVVASALSVICGAIICFIGLIRCGWIVDFISLSAISAYMTGSAINIAVAQVPALMGITGFSNRESTYKVVINILKHLGRTKLDAAMGLTALTMLYGIRSICNFGARRMPHKAKTFFFISTLRTAFVILLYTMISWLANRHHRKKPIFAILGVVPRGFQNAAVPTINKKIIKYFIGHLPASVIVILIEHIAIAKSFGRVNNYTIDPSQEMVAIGVTNLLGPFLGAYPATGSFSRTAIKSKAGVRTPFAGVFTALVVLLAIYALTAVFFYIPSSSLSAVIIHAVGDLITPPNTLYQFWRISPLEVIIFFAGVFVTIFSNIENGIYTTICVSLGVLLFRVVKAKGRFLGKVRIHSVIGDHLMEDEGKNGGHGQYGSFGPNDPDKSTRNLFLPISHNDGSNPEIEVESPYPGIFIYRFSEGFNYPNANHYLDYMIATIFKETRRTNPSFYPKLGVSSLLPNPIPLQHRLTHHLGSALERPWPSPRQTRPRRTRQTHPQSHHPRLLLGQQRRHHIRPTPHRRPQPTRPLRRPGHGGLAPRLHQQPLDQTRPRLGRLRLPDPAGRHAVPRALEARLQRRRHWRTAQRRGGRRVHGERKGAPAPAHGGGGAGRRRRRQGGRDRARPRPNQLDERQRPGAAAREQQGVRRRQGGADGPGRARARAQPAAVPHRPDERAAERHCQRRGEGRGGVRQGCGYCLSGAGLVLGRNAWFGFFFSLWGLVLYILNGREREGLISKLLCHRFSFSL